MGSDQRETDRARPPGLRCARCDYDLHGHTAEGVCPECGLAVSESIDTWHATPTLARARRAQLFVLALGTWLLLAGALYELAWGFDLIRVSGVLFRGDVWYGMFAIMHIGGGLLFLRIAESPGRSTWRRRALAGAYITGVLIVWCLIVHDTIWPPQANSSIRLLLLYYLPVLLINASGWLRLAWLARRLPSPFLAWMSVLLAAGTAVAFGETLWHQLHNWNGYVAGAHRPFLLDSWTIAFFTRNTWVGWWEWSLSLAQSLKRAAFDVAAFNAWASCVLLAPLATMTLSLLSMRFTRAWLTRVESTGR